MNDDLRKWLEGRPPVIHRLAAEYPPGSAIVANDGSRAYVVGYCEDGGITATLVPPTKGSYDAALDERFYICAACLADDGDAFREWAHGVNGCPQP